jgi:hypothetical protein
MLILRKAISILSFYITLILVSKSAFGQEVPQSITNYGIYEFLDELATNQIISINSVIKPYSRLLIASKLREAEDKREMLNPRQQKELAFYMMDFGKELNEKGRYGTTPARPNKPCIKYLWLDFGRSGGAKSPPDRTGRELKKYILTPVVRAGRRDLFYYKDSLFSFTVNPILGGELFTNSSGNATYWRNGAEVRAYVQKWGFFASLRDNHEKPLLGLPPYLTNREGGHLKGTGDWSEMQGGVTYGWKWGSAGLVKDRLQWGNNYNGANIFGGNNPTFVQFRLHITPVKWFDFNYFHGWLNSMVVDSNRSYWVNNSYGPDYREVYHKKFIAANMFTFIPLKNLYVSAGNSIVYSDIGLFPAYLIPVFFYKSVDHSVNSGIDNMNSQMFFDISSRQIKNLHLYAGFRVTDFPVSNLTFTTEFTYSYPLTFQHYVPTLTFESNGYNLGHYLRDNSREWYIALSYRPVRTLNLNLYFVDAIRGPDYTEHGGSRLGNPPLASVEWHNTTIGFRASYQIINDVYSWFSFAISDITGDSRWSPDYFYGKKNTLNLGVSVGF